MDILILIALTTLCFSFEIIFGLAGTILFMTFASFFFDLKPLMVFALLPQFSTSLFALYGSRMQIDWKKFRTIIAYALTGAVFGLLTFNYISENALKLTLGIVTVLGGLAMLYSSKTKLPDKFLKLLDLSAGFIQALLATSGPIVATRFLNTYTDKTQIRNNILLFFLIINIFRFSGFAIQGSIDWGVCKLWLYTAPVLFPAMYFSNRWHSKIPASAYRTTIIWVVISCGIYFLIDN